MFPDHPAGVAQQPDDDAEPDPSVTDAPCGHDRLRRSDRGGDPQPSATGPDHVCDLEGGACDACGSGGEAAAAPVAAGDGDSTVGPMATKTLADHKRNHARIAAIRPPVRTDLPARTRRARRPTVALADIVRLPAAAGADVPTDAARVQADGRVSLASCFATLDWRQGDRLTVTVGDGTASLTRSHTDHGLVVGVRGQVVLPRAVRTALGVAPGGTVVAVASRHDNNVQLLGPQATADATAFTRLDTPVRDAMLQLAPALTPTRLTRLIALLAALDDARLTSLATLPADQLRALIDDVDDDGGAQRPGKVG